MQAIRVGIVGFGLSGSVFHAPLLDALQEFEVSAVVTSRPEAVYSKYRRAKVVTTIEELLQIPEIDLVIVANPNYHHFTHARLALDAGKHVVVEKPFVPHSEQGRDLIALAESKGLMLTVFHNRRWDGDFLTIKQLIQNGDLGEVMHFESHFDRFKLLVDQRWKEQDQEANGNFYDLGSHLIDQTLALFGLPEKVIADIGTQRVGAKADDFFHIVLKYGRMRAILHGGTLVAAPVPRFQIHGTRGSFIKYGLDPQENQLKAGKKPGDVNWGIESETSYGVLHQVDGDLINKCIVPTQTGCYEEFYRQVYACIRHGAAAPVDPQAAVQVIKLIEDAKFI